MIINAWIKPENNEDNIYKPYKIFPGVTMIIGPNGCGKTTFLKQLKSFINNDSDWNFIEENKLLTNYSCFYYNNKNEEKFRKQDWLETNIHKLASTFGNSEGQDIYDFFSDQVPEIGRLVREAKLNNKPGIFILLDGLDSGLSIDLINTIRTGLLDFIIKEEQTDKFEVYIICSANSFEFCHDYNSVDIETRQNKIYKRYSDFEKRFLKK